jgi:hypothetical protein
LVESVANCDVKSSIFYHDDCHWLQRRKSSIADGSTNANGEISYSVFTLKFVIATNMYHVQVQTMVMFFLAVCYDLEVCAFSHCI